MKLKPMRLLSYMKSKQFVIPFISAIVVGIVVAAVTKSTDDTLEIEGDIVED